MATGTPSVGPSHRKGEVMQLLHLNDGGHDETPAPQVPKWWRPLITKVLHFILKDVLLRGVATYLWKLIITRLFL